MLMTGIKHKFFNLRDLGLVNQTGRYKIKGGEYPQHGDFMAGFGDSCPE